MGEGLFNSVVGFFCRASSLDVYFVKSGVTYNLSETN